MLKTHQVLGKMVSHDKSALNSVIIAHVKRGELHQALTLYLHKEKGEPFHFSTAAYVALLQACSALKDLNTGLCIHAEFARGRTFTCDAFVGSTLIDMYAKISHLTKAQEVFDGLCIQNTVCWTALICAYVEAGYSEEALYHFEIMEQCDDIFMDAVIYVSGLKACSSTNAIEKGKEMHDGIIKRGFEGHLATGSILVDMYAKCGFLEEAQKVFEKLKFQDVVSWTALIGGYAARGFSEETLNLFQEMKHKDISPDAGTYVCCLQVCGDMKTSYNWWELHSDIVKAGFDKDIFVSSTLVYMLAKCGLLDEAQRVFDRAAVHNMVIWTALITGYADLGHNDKALDCCYQMQKEGISLASATLICGLKGCGSSGSIKQGRMLHLEIAKKGLDTELNVANTLVDMYAKCGHLADAEEVFCKLQSCSLISWTALITGYAQLGNGKAVFDTFKRMLAEGLQPNFVTLISLLSVCSHAGLLTEGLLYFYYAIHEYNLIPCVEHYTCIADLLGRAGHIDKAVTLIQKMPCHPSIGLWLSVLGACKKWGDTNLGQVAFENMIQLDDRVSAAYIDMHNIYADIRAQ